MTDRSRDFLLVSEKVKYAVKDYVGKLPCYQVNDCSILNLEFGCPFQKRTKSAPSNLKNERLLKKNEVKRL